MVCCGQKHKIVVFFYSNNKNHWKTLMVHNIFCIRSLWMLNKIEFKRKKKGVDDEKPLYVSEWWFWLVGCLLLGWRVENESQLCYLEIYNEEKFVCVYFFLPILYHRLLLFINKIKTCLNIIKRIFQKCCYNVMVEFIHISEMENNVMFM